MKIIVGLGNPGSEYKNTRHNMGFNYLDHYLNNYKKVNVIWKNKFNGIYFETNINGEKVIFVKPLTFMNSSGECVSKFVNYYKIDKSDLLVVHDDMDLNIGNFKLKDKGSSGGHNGIKSIIELLGTDCFKRLKIGISKSNNADVIDYVLGKFNNDDLEIYAKLFKDLDKVLDDYFNMDFYELMSKYNRKNR